MNNNKEGVYKLSAHFGRSAYLSGIFIAPKKHVEYLISQKIEVYFGEVAGKHSEVYGELSWKEIEFITDDLNVVQIFKKHKLGSGLNPFDYQSINFADGEMSDWQIREIIEFKLKEHGIC